jgi:hypothetical protein
MVSCLSPAPPWRVSLQLSAISRQLSAFISVKIRLSLPLIEKTPQGTAVTQNSFLPAFEKPQVLRERGWGEGQLTIPFSLPIGKPQVLKERGWGLGPGDWGLGQW